MSMIDETPRRGVRRTIVAATIGTALEWYDFYVFGLAAALVFPKLFFPHAAPQIGLIESFATFAGGFLARPFGAVIFGHLGDRFGRRLTLILTMILMGIGSLVVGFLPTYGAIGVWAPILLVALRLVQGIGIGGEWGNAALITMEQDESGRRRGFFASWAGFGAPFGAVVSTGTMLVVSTLSSDFGGAGLTAGWRWPFYFSVVLIAAGLFIRLRTQESPIFEEAKRRGAILRQPMLELLLRNPRAVVAAALLRAAENGTYYLYAAFVLSYGVKTLHQSRTLLLAGVTIAAALTMPALPWAGHLSDRLGRKKVIYIGIAMTALWAFPYYGLLGSGNTVVIFLAVCVSLLPWSFQYGPQPAFIAESFPANVRSSGAGLGYQVGGALWGGCMPVAAAALLPYSVWLIALSFLVLCGFSIIGLRLLPDRTGLPLPLTSADP